MLIENEKVFQMKPTKSYKGVYMDLEDVYVKEKELTKICYKLSDSVTVVCDNDELIGFLSKIKYYYKLKEQWQRISLMLLQIL
jgi:hypothetical protein